MKEQSKFAKAIEGIQQIRNRLHAANRPQMREQLRRELRDFCDELLKELAAEPAKN